MTNREKIAVPLLDLKAQFIMIEPEIRAAIDRVLDTQRFIMGPEVEALENEVAFYSDCEFGIGVSSGTDALLVSLMALDIKFGDEVITTPYTFFATAGSISRVGAKPVFADIDPASFNIDPDRIEAAITEKTKAIIPVHLYGQMADMDPIMDLAKRHGLYVIEDAAQAIGAVYEGRRAGSIGDLGCFSFFPSKNLGGFGDGGMVSTNNPELADRIRLFRNHGYRPKYYNKVVGGNFRLDAIQAAILRVKLTHLDEWTSARQKNALIYNELFNGNDLVEERWNEKELENRNGIFLPGDGGLGKHIFNQFVIRASQRDELKKYLLEHDIGCEIYYPVPLHLQECFADLGYGAGDFPESENAARETLALPIYPEINLKMQTEVVETISEFYQAS